VIEEVGEWHLWHLTIPTKDKLTDEDLAWMKKRGWEIYSPQVVRVISPPPLGFENAVPVYPAPRGGWVLMRDPDGEESLEPNDLWAMGNPLPGTWYRLEEGHAPKAAKCQALPAAWSYIPHPTLELRSPDGRVNEMDLLGGLLSFPKDALKIEGLQVFIRSLFPIEVMAGSPGQTVKVSWRPGRPLDRVGAEMAKAIRLGKPYELTLVGPGLPRQTIRVDPAVERLEAPTIPNYHHRLRQMAGWPAYLLISKPVGA
jgi:hypothetical protein